jgi:hypothetical protein
MDLIRMLVAQLKPITTRCVSTAAQREVDEQNVLIDSIRSLLKQPAKLSHPPYWYPGSFVWEHWRKHFSLSEEDAEKRWLGKPTVSGFGAVWLERLNSMEQFKQLVSKKVAEPTLFGWLR